MCVYVYVSVCVCLYVSMYAYPTPLLEQDMTQEKILSGV